MHAIGPHAPAILPVAEPGAWPQFETALEIFAGQRSLIRSQARHAALVVVPPVVVHHFVTF